MPFGFLAGLWWESKVFPRQWGPWILGARAGRWPNKFDGSKYTLCRHADCERVTHLSLAN